MLCPHCSVELVMSDRAGVEIDYCPKCRGVWLDRGELDKILERSAREYAEPVQAQPQPQYQSPPKSYPGDDDRWKHSHHHPHYRKKKSFLDDLFDF